MQIILIDDTISRHNMSSRNPNFLTGRPRSKPIVIPESQRHYSAIHMSTVTDVSSRLGEYMLKGWVLTDEGCPNTNCRVPLMRSPKGQVPVTMFCANCDGDPQSERTALSFLCFALKQIEGRSSAPNPEVSPSGAGQSSPSTVSSDTRISRSSTPPTDVSSNLSSPTFALPVETAESARRRQQSDAASAEIGARLLKVCSIVNH